MVNAGVCHDSLVAITFPVGSFLAASLNAHLISLEGEFLWLFLAHPNLFEGVVYHEVCLFCDIGIEGFFLSCIIY